MTKIRKKLIEVALPLEAINAASGREKSIRHGHPSTLHLWWARRPLAAARAVIFSQMVDDPSEYVPELLESPQLVAAAEKALDKRRADFAAERERAGESADGEAEPTLEVVAADAERQRLFEIIEELVRWESTTDAAVLDKARAEIARSWRRTCVDNQDHPNAAELFDPENLPGFHDPFAGGGALPLEAQRLGLESYASDLNPVAVLINRAMIEIPPRFSGQRPVNPESRQAKGLIDRDWQGVAGLVQDVRYYGKWMRDEANRRIGHLYPTITVGDQHVAERPDLERYEGKELKVLAWLWARTVKSPNPAYREVDIPLVANFVLATKRGKEAYIEPLVGDRGYEFVVRAGRPDGLADAKAGTKLGRGANFRCLMSGSPVSGSYIREEARAGRMGARLLAIVAEGHRERVYLPPDTAHETMALDVEPEWQPDVEFFENALGFRIGNYGMTKWSDVFTKRQVTALSMFATLVHETCAMVERDAVEAGREDVANSYAKAVALYLGLSASKAADNNSTLCSWMSGVKYEVVRNTFSRQALPMTWDYAEPNPFGGSSGDFAQQVERSLRVLEVAVTSDVPGYAAQSDAQTQRVSATKVVSTDPPYYDNVGYADLSDFFYVWLRRSLGPLLPEFFTTVTVPKAEELVATPERHGGKQEAESFFMQGMTDAFECVARQANPAFPLTIYYAFKQSESEEKGGVSTGWEVFLDAVIASGCAITGTWPVRTEREARSRSIGSNALASSIVLVCRPRGAGLPACSRREFLQALKAELPSALRQLQKSNIAPVDLAQAAIGPGMAVYTRYSQVLESDDSRLDVRGALQLINRVLDEVLTAHDGELDRESLFAVTWFETHCFEAGSYGDAETLAKARNVSVRGAESAGILQSAGSKARLLKREELPADWNPKTDSSLTVWECTQHLIRRLENGSEALAAELLKEIGSLAEPTRALAYRLYAICERKKWAEEARSYNGLVTAWPEVERLAEATPSGVFTQADLIEGE